MSIKWKTKFAMIKNIIMGKPVMYNCYFDSKVIFPQNKNKDVVVSYCVFMEGFLMPEEDKRTRKETETSLCQEHYLYGKENI